MSGIILTDAPKVALPPLTKTEAEAFCSMEGVLKRYGLSVWYHCRTCFDQNPDHLVKTPGVKGGKIHMECACGVRAYSPPLGVSDMNISRPASPKAVERGPLATITLNNGLQRQVPTAKIEPEDAAIIVHYDRVVGALSLNAKICHLDCWPRKFRDDSACEVTISPTQIGIICTCRLLFFQGSAAVH